jgi:hypothetical protein
VSAIRCPTYKDRLIRGLNCTQPPVYFSSAPSQPCLINNSLSLWMLNSTFCMLQILTQVISDMIYHRFRRAGYQAIDRICDYHSSLRNRPVTSQVEPGYLRKALPRMNNCPALRFLLISRSQPPPPLKARTSSSSWMTIKSTSCLVLDSCYCTISPISFELTGLTHWQHPSFFAYFPTSSTFEGILAELYASSTSNPGFNVRLSTASLSPSFDFFVVVCEPRMYRA